MSNAASIRVPTNRNFHLDRDDDGYFHIYGRDVQTIRTNLNEMYGTSTTPAPEPQRARAPVHRKKRQLSPEARGRIAAAQKKRWAASRKATKTAPKVMAAGG